MNVIIKKRTDKRRVFETPVLCTESDDFAVIKCAMLNSQEVNKDVKYYVSDIEHNDTESVECWRDTNNDSIYLMDENGTKIYLDIELKRETVELPFHETVAPDVFDVVQVRKVTLLGTDIEDLKISDELKRSINNEAENVAQEQTDSINDI